MRRVQKAAAVLAALALTTALAVPVWADGTTSVDNQWEVNGTSGMSETEKKITVNATYEKTTVYRVDLEWTNMEFTYTAGTWTTEDGDNSLTYVDAKGWNNNKGDGTPDAAKAIHTIKIKNYSNENIGVQLDYTNSDPEDDTQSTVGNVTRNRVGCFFIPNNASDLSITNYGSHMIQKGSKIWLQRADANVAGMSPDLGSGTSQKFDTADLITKGTAVEAEIGVMMAGRPSKAHNKTEIGTLTITLSDAGETLAKPTTSADYAWAFTQDNMANGGEKVS